MAYTMDKIIPVTGILDNTTCSSVDFVASNTGTNRGLCCFMCGSINVVDLNELRVWFACNSFNPIVTRS